MNQHGTFSAGQRIETLRQLFRSRRGPADAAQAPDALHRALQRADAGPAWQDTEWPDTQWSDTNIEPPTLLEF